MFSLKSSLVPLLAASLTVKYFYSSLSGAFCIQILSSPIYLVNISSTHPFIQPVFIEPMCCACQGLISGHHGHGCLHHTFPITHKVQARLLLVPTIELAALGPQNSGLACCSSEYIKIQYHTLVSWFLDSSSLFIIGYWSRWNNGFLKMTMS